MRQFTPAVGLHRRALLSLVAASAFAGPALGAGKAPAVAMLGDSITAGFGLAAADALPAQLAAALARSGHPVAMHAAGVSGDTTADALARVDFSVAADTALCIVALGGNDLLQGVEPAVVKANLTAIAARLKARRIGVLICGMRAPDKIGAAYAHAFNAVFADVAKAQHAALYPNLLEGVGGDARLNQRDGIHPNSAGVKIIAARLAPAVAKALAARRP
jgi:acyl-CoA thioesterase-1